MSTQTNTRTNTVLITGASSGIGLDVARAFLAKGSNVVLNGRDENKLLAAAESLGSRDRIGDKSNTGIAHVSETPMCFYHSGV